MEKGHYGHYSGNARHSKHMTNSWEEEDVKRGKKQSKVSNQIDISTIVNIKSVRAIKG